MNSIVKDLYNAAVLTLAVLAAIGFILGYKNLFWAIYTCAVAITAAGLIWCVIDAIRRSL